MLTGQQNIKKTNKCSWKAFVFVKSKHTENYNRIINYITLCHIPIILGDVSNKSVRVLKPNRTLDTASLKLLINFFPF